MRQVIDTRFFIEHFYSKDPQVQKKTKQRLKELTEKQEGAIPTIVLAELVKITCEKRGREEADLRHNSVLRSGLSVVELNSDLAREAGLLRCRYRDVPIGDCIIASVAIATRATVLTDDPHFSKIKHVKTTWI